MTLKSRIEKSRSRGETRGGSAGHASTSGPVLAEPSLSPFWRGVISLLLIGHLLAVFFPPFTFATRTGPQLASPFAMPVLRFLKPYVDLMYLDHGYFFFAPNPGPSHLLRARIEYVDSRPPLEITLPDRDKQWPRLLYHRHFMLSEQFRDTFVPPQPPRELSEDPAQLADWRAGRAIYELRRRSFEEHLKARYGARQVTLTRVEHSLLTPEQFITQGGNINRPETYFDLPEDSGPPPSPILGLRP